jgi:hypothetical protein
LKIKFYTLLAVFVAIYLYTVFAFAVDNAALARYHVNATQLRFLSLTIIIPIFAIWFTLFYGMINVSHYAKSIAKSKEGASFKFLALGLTVQGVSMPINSIISRFLTYGTQNGMVSVQTNTIITTHLTILCSLAAFVLIFIGAYKLLNTIKVRIPSWHLMVTGLMLSILSVFYTFATISNPARQVATGGVPKATYAMNDWGIVLTIIIPYVMLWAFGLFAVQLLRIYYHNVGGSIYKRSLAKLNKGFLIVTLSYILLQFVTATATVISGFALTTLFALIYVLLAIIATGYVYVAVGAKGLTKLEEVT